LQRRDKSGFIVVVDGDGADARGKGAFAVCACERGYGVLACLQEVLSDVFAHGAAGLVVMLVRSWRRMKQTYAHDSDAFDAVGETGGLVFGVLLGHVVGLLYQMG
jgi:hypothetical protein